MKKHKFLISLIIFPLLLSNCKKESSNLPTISIKPVTNITEGSVTTGGEIISNGGVAVSSCGICWSTEQNPTTADNKTSEMVGNGSFTSQINGLSPGTTYYLRAYASNSVGLGYSDQISFSTLASLPVLTTTDPSDIQTTSVNCSGEISSDGGSAVIERGFCWSTNNLPTISDNKIKEGTGTGTFKSAITGLNAGTKYYFRAYATNNIGTSYGNVVNARTTDILPEITTKPITNITAISAVSGGNIGNGTVPIDKKGVCWSTSPHPTYLSANTIAGYNFGEFTSEISGLTPNTTYYARAFGLLAGMRIIYGEEFTFQTPAFPGGTMTDIDGNVYRTVTIGTQVWMAENLRTTRYRNGDPIRKLTSSVDWYQATSGAYSFDEENSAPEYGFLYNGYSALDSRKIAPDGWHIPTDAEWTILTDFLGGSDTAGGKLKEKGYYHWSSPNVGATNETYFSALPAGPGNLSVSSGWFSSTAIPDNSAIWVRSMFGINSTVKREQYGLSNGCYVRCIKD